MAANDRIKVSSQNRQEQVCLDELRPYLRPWRCTFVDQRDDFGRDGVVQIVDEEGEECFIIPLTFWVQCKSYKGAFEDNHSDSIETRHLALWTDQFALPLFLVIWSVADQQFRFRSARSVREELDRSNPDWKDQATVSVHYRRYDGYSTPQAAQSAIVRMLKDEMDTKGGVETFHATRRRVVLTTLIPAGRVETSKTMQAEGSRPITLVVGEGWLQGDLNAYEVSADRALAAALLLYEEVWAPMWSVRVCLDLLGEDLTFDLLERERIKLFTTIDTFGFRFDRGAVTGELVSIQRHEDQTMEVQIQRLLDPKYAPSVSRRLTSYIVAPSEIQISRVLEITVADLKRENLRKLLGLRPLIADEEPAWDAILVNRLASFNFSRTFGQFLRADVVQYEGGMSRLASEKDYDLYGLNRRFENIRVFDATLRHFGVPDLGQLLQRIPLHELIVLSDGQGAQAFRDWFWSEAAALIGSGADLTRSFLQHVEHLVQQDLRSFRFVQQLKLRFFQPFDSGYVLGCIVQPKDPAFATTDAKGEETLARQRRIYCQYRQTLIKDQVGGIDPYAKCPCGSGDKYRFCCGRTLGS